MKKIFSFGIGSFSILVGLLFPPAVMAQLHLSDLPASEGHIAAPHDHRFLHKSSSEALGGFNALVPYVMASPDQEDAGSCLYMAITGIAEWWLARLHPTVSRAADGPLDLSERFIMNFAGMEENEAGLPNWRTDAIYLFNRNGNKSLLNSTYRYTKGWFLGEEYSDHLTPAAEDTPGAQYGTLFNWIDQRPKDPKEVVQLPAFERDVIFADPASNEWNVGVAPDDIVDKVKETLRTRESPVLVIYNQNSYWHAVSIVGYNDDMDNGKCAYTESFRIRISDRAAELARLADEATDPVVKSAYQVRAQRAKEAKDKIEHAYATRGGCTSSKGVFYIRDSIYPDENGPLYDYDPSRPDAKAPYAKKIVFKEYDWLRYFSNHVSVVYPKTK